MLRERRAAAREIEDSVVVVTGASSGIGRATALAMAEHGARGTRRQERGEPARGGRGVRRARRA